MAARRVFDKKRDYITTTDNTPYVINIPTLTDVSCDYHVKICAREISLIVGSFFYQICAVSNIAGVANLNGSEQAIKPIINSALTITAEFSVDAANFQITLTGGEFDIIEWQYLIETIEN